MIRWPKARAVARFELLSTIRRTGYLVITLGMPIFAVMYAALALIPDQALRIVPGWNSRVRFSRSPR